MVIGDKFFVKNDIDNKENHLEYISIKNDQSTDHLWEVAILKEKN